MPSHIQDRLDLLRARGWFPALVLGLALVGYWDLAEFSVEKWRWFAGTTIGINVAPLLSSSAAWVLVSIIWLAWLLVRPPSTMPRLYRMKRLLREAEAQFREDAKKPRPKEIDDVTEFSVRWLRLIKFLGQACMWPVRDEFAKREVDEGDRWRDIGQTHNASLTTADLLAKLRRRLTNDDLDFGFKLPASYSEYDDDWPNNQRPIPAGDSLLTRLVRRVRTAAT